MIINGAEIPPVLKFDDVRLVRSGRDILRGITWELPAGGVGAVLGPNGSGKSTLLRIATGYLWPTTGRCSFDGRELGTFPVAELRRQVAIVEASSVVPFAADMTALDVVCSGLLGKLTTAYDHFKNEEIDRATELAELVGLHHHLDQAYETLSTGERMRALLARGLIGHPQLLILDECTNGLDIPSRESYLATINAICDTPHRPAILVVTHYPEELPRKTRHILLLNSLGGMQVSGGPSEVMTSEQFSAAFKWPITIRHDNGRYRGEAAGGGWQTS